MKRLVDWYLRAWKDDKYRQPLLLRGARQVGKTFAVRELGKLFSSYVEINLESLQEEGDEIFRNLDPKKIVDRLSIIANKAIIPGETLLFIDEIQAIPRALTALRYFYELMPELHVIAAGSLLDFAIEKVGVPVGRVQGLYMYPLSFIEFLSATGEHMLLKELLKHEATQGALFDIAHNRLLERLGEYLVLGGMPQAIARWVEQRAPLQATIVHSTLLDFYRQDFNKYAKVHQVKYVELIFDQVPRQLGRKFKYSLVEGEYRKRELAPALDLLVTAGIAQKVFYAAGQGMPLGALVDPLDYKTLFFDVGLSQSLLGLDIAGWFLHPHNEFVNKGSLVESFVGQEILVYSSPRRKKQLFFWHRAERTSQAEIDYLIQKQERVIPIEVKSGSGKTLKSLHQFLETHQQSPYGIRFSTQNYSLFQNVHSYPLYAIAKVMSEEDDEMCSALETLV